MAAKRKSRPAQPSTDTESGFAVHVDKDDIEALELAAPVHLATGEKGERAVKPIVPKAGPAPRGALRAGAANRGQGAPPARRYAFRRS